jgi:TrmH family RNA methyltransferase
MEAITQVKTPQGIAAVVGLPEWTPLSAMGKKLVLLENVQDPGNVGTILRTLDAAGFDGCVLTSGCADPFSPKTLRATMGSVFRVPMATLPDAISAMAELKESGYALLAAALSGEPFYERGPLPPKLCLMIGNEGAGLTQAAIKAATCCFRLPMAGGAESLNAAVAAAVMMYDIGFR